MCIANRRTPYFTECRSLSLNTSLKPPTSAYAVVQSVSPDRFFCSRPCDASSNRGSGIKKNSSCFIFFLNSGRNLLSLWNKR